MIPLRSARSLSSIRLAITNQQLSISRSQVTQGRDENGRALVRFYSTSHSSNQTERKNDASKRADEGETRTRQTRMASEFRLAMRQLAYPVAILTVTMKDKEHQHQHQHGSTISSMTSIAMKPEPMISLSIQTPSRLADHLCLPTSQPFVIHLLNHNPQSIDIASRFSKPKLRFDPDLFHQLDKISMAKLHCQILQFIKLPPTTTTTTTTTNITSDNSSNLDNDRIGFSTLFIARVNHFHLASDQKPLLYHNQGYTTVNTQE